MPPVLEKATETPENPFEPRDWTVRKICRPRCRPAGAGAMKGRKMRLPKDWLSYPVFIEVAGTHGTGFFLTDDNWIYLVSAAHVLFKDKIETYDVNNGGPVKLTSSRPSSMKSTSSQNYIELDCLRLVGEDNLLKHELADVAVCRIAKVGGDGNAPDGVVPIKFQSGIVHKCGGLGGWALDRVLRFDDVALGGAIIMFGYPTSLAGSFFSKDTPLLRGGIVAGKTDSGAIVIDCPVYFGNSGALVLEREPGHTAQAIGVVVRMIPFKETLYSREFRQDVGVRYENSGYAIVEPMDRVIELIDRFKPPAEPVTECP